MRLILVHGINQQGKSEEIIRANWLSQLEVGLGRSLSDTVQVFAPFYGDKLHELTTNVDGNVVTQGGGNWQAEGEEVAFFSSALGEIALAAGIGKNEIEIEQRSAAGDISPVEQGIIMNRRFNAMARLLERVSPFQGAMVMRLLRQANCYLKKPGVGNQIDAIVRPVVDIEPAVIIAHSLGTVVAFKILRQLALERRAVHVPLFVTLGSPLGLKAVKAALGPKFSRPPGVERWLNAVDSDDFVTLGKGLDARTFSADIENFTDIENDEHDPHSTQLILNRFYLFE